MSSQQPRAITIAILAMGGEGGGVLADWLVDLAEHNGHLAQTTSVPGVAQRTGATVYYIEMLAQADVPAGAQPVFALAPVPGQCDVVIASELMEAGRALQRGLVTPDRTTLVASTHRVYSMTERTATGDGRVDAAQLLAGAQAAAKRCVHADFAALAQCAGSPIAPALYGALAATGALSFTRAQFEDTVRRAGVGVAASLAAFGAGFDAVDAPDVAAPAAPPALPAVGPRLAALAQRIGTQFPPAAHATLRHGILRLADYQDEAYAAEYLDKLAPLQAASLAAQAAGNAVPATLLDAAARHLALWMSYEDTVRVADLKTRRSRFERVRGEVALQPGQQIGIAEFMHPRVDEIADTLPACVGRWLLATPWARGTVGRFTRVGRVVRTSTLAGYLLLYAVASLRSLRRRSLRHATEQRRITAWLATVQQFAATQPALALEVVRLQRLVKGYGETHARGWRSFSRVIDALPRLQQAPGAVARLQALHAAALADDSGAALDGLLAELH